MADITVTTDFSQVNNLKEALQSADTAYVRVVDSVVRENNRLKSLLKKAAKDTEETNKIKEQADAIYTAKLQQEADKRERVRAREAAKAEKEAQRIEAANQKLIASEVKLRAESEKRAAASAQGFQSQIGGNLGLGARGISASASGSAFEGEIERLRQKYDQVYASSQLYERSLNELNKAHALGVLSAKQHESAVESLNQEYQNFQNGIALAGNRFATHVNQTSTGMNKFGMAAQQTGYQVSDFLVQIQGGTNPLVAFSQQATQLTGLLYIMSPALLASRVSFVAFSLSMSTAIAGVTILVPLLAMLAMAFANSGKESDKAAKSVDKQTEAYDALIAKVEQLRLARQMEATGISSKEEQVVQNNLSELLAKRAVLQERLNNLQKLGGRGAGFAEQATEQKALLQVEIDKNNEAIRAINYEEQLETAQKRRANERRNDLREEQAERARLQRLQAQQLEVMGRTQAEQAAKVEAAIIRANQVYAKTRVEAAAAQAALKEALSSKDAEQLNRAMEEALSAGLEFSRVDLNAIVALAAKNGWSLVGAIRAAAQAAQVGNVVTADPSMGPGFERGGKLRSTFRQVAYQPTLDEIIAGQSKKGGGGDKKDPLEELRQQIALENELLGVSEAQARVIQALGQDRSKYSEAEIDAITAEIEAYNQKLEAVERTKQIMDTVKSSMEDAFMSMVDGTKSAKDAFRSMAAEIVKELYRVLVVQQLVGAIGGAFGGGGGSFFSAPSTGSFGLPFGGANASGGSVMPGKSYLVGENGPELVIPRHSGTVVNANQTANMGGGSGTTVVNNNISVTGSDAAMVRVEIAKMIPQITNATKAAVIDAKQRGGQMAQAFR